MNEEGIKVSARPILVVNFFVVYLLCLIFFLKSGIFAGIYLPSFGFFGTYALRKVRFRCILIIPDQFFKFSELIVNFVTFFAISADQKV